MSRRELARDRFDLDARHGFRGLHRRGADRAVGEESLRHADAADRQRFEPLGLETAADDELGRAAADVDDEPRLERARQLVRDAEVGEARLFVAADDVDRKADRALGARQELARVRRDAKRVRRDDAHADGCRPDSRSRKRARQASAACIAAGFSRPLASSAAPRRSVSRQVSSW